MRWRKCGCRCRHEHHDDHSAGRGADMGKRCRRLYGVMGRRLTGVVRPVVPVAGALQAALGIRLAPEEIAKEDERAALTPRLADEDYFLATERQFRYRPRLVIGRDDTDAARLVVTRAATVLTLAAIRKKRWRAMIGDDFLADWTIIKRVLVQHQSIRDLAQELGLDKSGSGLSYRFREAIKAIAEVMDRCVAGCWLKSARKSP